MRILFVAPYTPNPIRVRPYSLIQALLDQGHELTVATLWESPEEQEQLDVLRAWGARVLAFPLSRSQKLRNVALALPQGLPLQARFSWQPAFARALVEEANVGNYDVVHVEHLRGAIYGTHLMQNTERRAQSAEQQSLRVPRSAFRVPVLWDSVDCISHLFTQAAARSRSQKGRLMTRFELARTRRHEAWLLDQFDHTTVTSEADRTALLALHDAATVLPASASRQAQNGNDAVHRLASSAAASAAVSVLPNGVDTTYFAASEVRTARPTIVVSGKMSYHANVSMVLDLVDEIMPRVWQDRPDVQLWVVGKDPPPAITRLDPEWRIDRRPPAMGDARNRIVVTGFVDDIRPYLQQAWVAAAPVRYGAGIQNKVLEAMACSTPVVVTPPAVAALAAEDGSDLLIGTDAAGAAGAILDLIRDEGRARAIGRRGAAFVRTRHSWFSAAAELTDIYRSLAPPASRQREQLPAAPVLSTV